MRMLPHVCASENYNHLQSTYRGDNSMATALLKILNDVCQSSDSKNVTLLAVLDISSAFDNVTLQLSSVDSNTVLA